MKNKKKKKIFNFCSKKGVSVEDVRALLLSYKHKTRSFEWRVGTPMIQGQW